MDSPELPDPFTLRPMRPDDLPRVRAIEESVKPVPWPEETFTAELGNPLARSTVLTAGKEIAGYVITWLVAGELQVHTLIVAPAYRQRGLGELLLVDALLSGLRRGMSTATLDVRAGNVAALALYRRLGFRETGRRPGYYRDNGETAVLMDLTAGRPGLEKFLSYRLAARAASLAGRQTLAAKVTIDGGQDATGASEQDGRPPASLRRN